MEIAKLGEFGLIDRLTKDIKPQNESTKYGVGDDCAVLHYPDSEVLVTTDMLMEESTSTSPISTWSISGGSRQW